MTKVRGQVAKKQRHKTKQAPREKRGQTDRHGVPWGKVEARGKTTKRKAGELLAARSRAWRRLDRLKEGA